MSEASSESNSRTLEPKRPGILNYEKFVLELEGSGFEKIYEDSISEKEVQALLKRLRPTRRDIIIAGSSSLALVTASEYLRRKITPWGYSNKPTGSLQIPTTRNVHKDEALTTKSSSDTNKTLTDNNDKSTASYAIEKNAEEDVIQKITNKLLASVPNEAYESAKMNIPLVLKALKEQGLTDPKIVAYTMATIEHETAKTFEPIKEIEGENQAVKNKYSGGKNYYGRGFIQLTHDYNYAYMSLKLGIDLIHSPDKALDPDIAAKILAIWIKEKVNPLLLDGTIEEFENARKGVNSNDKASKIASLAQNYLDTLRK